MNFVVDANIIFSILIKEGKSAEILANFSYDFFAPEFLFDEIRNHKDEILIKTYRTEKELNDILNQIKEVLTIYSKKEFEDYLNEAEKISPDEKDIEYFALALKLSCAIWSNDKLLKNQNRIKVYSTNELLKLV